MANEILFYRTPNGEERIEVVFREENFWMTQKALAELFGVGTPAIYKHLKNIYESGELAEDRTISKMETVRMEGISDFDREVKRIQGKTNDKS